MIPLFKMNYEESDLKAIRDVIERGTNWAEGAEIENFEKGLCDYMGVPGALVCNSGTSALHIALLACGINWRHEVIVPSFTFIATVNSVRFVGATPVFADIEDETLGLDPQDVESKITSKTKAIIAVHYAGGPCKIQELSQIARKHSLLLIEDCAEAMGATYDDRKVGTFGDCAILSFCQNKIISTGEGGAFITRNKYLYDQAKLIRSHGRQGDYQNGDYVSLGYNFRMSSINAALGLSQLKRIDEFIAKRRHIVELYEYYLQSLDYDDNTGSGGNVFQLYTIRSLKRDLIMKHLHEKGIGCKVYFNPVHLTPYYKRDKWQTVSLPVTERISKEVLSLPIYPDLTENEVKEVCDAIKEVL